MLNISEHDSGPVPVHSHQSLQSLALLVLFRQRLLQEAPQMSVNSPCCDSMSQRLSVQRLIEDGGRQEDPGGLADAEGRAGAERNAKGCGISCGP